MNKISEKLKQIKDQKRLALMTHVVVGYPSLSLTEEIIKTMNHCGVDFIELQIPFSDPLADGPTIMKACEVSLGKGTKVRDSFLLAKNISNKVSSVLIFTAYYNTVFKYGVEKFCRDAAKAGVAGLIVPDIPLEEEKNEHFLAACRKTNLIPIRVISPVSNEERLKQNLLVASGFVYCTARQGITGAKKDLDRGLAKYLRMVRKYFKIPIAVGFGISKREHMVDLKSYADIAVVGSAIIDVINSSKEGKIEKDISKFIRGLSV